MASRKESSLKVAERESLLREIVTRVCRQDASRLDLDDDLIRELVIDSLAGLRILAAVEKRFAVRFPDERLSEFRSLRKLLDFTDPRSGERERTPR